MNLDTFSLDLLYMLATVTAVPAALTAAGMVLAAIIDVLVNSVRVFNRR